MTPQYLRDGTDNKQIIAKYYRDGSTNKKILKQYLRDGGENKLIFLSDITQDITLPSSNYSEDEFGTTSVRWLFPAGSRIAINEEFVPTGTSRLLSNIQINQDGSILLNFAANNIDSDARADLIDAFESSGYFTLESQGNSLTVQMAGMDTSDPYQFTPTNSADVTAFYNDMKAETGSSHAGELTLGRPIT